MDSGISDAVYQDQILPHVSRTFALTIPQLPAELRISVTNAYLLCRIADTIEDEPALSPPETLAFLQRFMAALAGRGDPQALSQGTRETPLGSNPADGARIGGQYAAGHQRDRGVERSATHGDSSLRRAHVLWNAAFSVDRQLATDCPRLTDLDDYCYYVAGVVGRHAHRPVLRVFAAIARRRAGLQAHAVSFAQGLQMTNILKDVWEDRSRGACWLPQDVFSRHGVDLSRLAPEPSDPRFAAGMQELVAVAHAHLRNALEYTLLIPAGETGIRRFCLWAIGLAVLTLQKINQNPRFTAGVQVKVSRRAVAMTRISTDFARRNDWLLRRLFERAARGLPLVQLGENAPAAPGPPDRCAVRGRRVRTRARTRACPAPFVREFGNVSRIAQKPSIVPAPSAKARADIVSHALTKAPATTALDRAVAEARDALIARQSAQGYWLFELEADCTIPAEYIMMMHFLDEIDAPLEKKLAVYLRAHQADHGGWPLYHGGDFNMSCTVKAYYALKLFGDDPEAPHMARARAAILERGGAARSNVFTRIALALFGQLPWRGVPYIPVEIMLLPKWFPFHLDKVAYWSRTVMVPLFILCTRKPLAKNPRKIDVRELFVTAPEDERGYFRDAVKQGGMVARAFLVADRLGRMIDPLIPRGMRERATRRAEEWMLERLNGEDGLGCDFPGHGQRAGGDDHPGLSARRRSARDRQARVAEVAGGGPRERLLPTLRFARLGYGVGNARHAGSRRCRGDRRRYAGDGLAADGAGTRRAGRLAREASRRAGRRLGLPVREQPLSRSG